MQQPVRLRAVLRPRRASTSCRRRPGRCPRRRRSARRRCGGRRRRRPPRSPPCRGRRTRPRPPRSPSRPACRGPPCPPSSRTGGARCGRRRRGGPRGSGRSSTRSRCAASPARSSARRRSCRSRSIAPCHGHTRRVVELRVMAPAANSRTSVADAGWNCPSNGFEDRIPEEERNNPFSWINPVPLWQSRNDRVVRRFGDPTNDERRAWMELVRATHGADLHDRPQRPRRAVVHRRGRHRRGRCVAVGGRPADRADRRADRLHGHRERRHLPRGRRRRLREQVLPALRDAIRARSTRCPATTTGTTG